MAKFFEHDDYVYVISNDAPPRTRWCMCLGEEGLVHWAVETQFGTSALPRCYEETKFRLMQYGHTPPAYDKPTCLFCATVPMKRMRPQPYDYRRRGRW